MSIITRPNRILRPNKHGILTSAPQGGAPSAAAGSSGALPNETDIILWYDYTDTTTLWQNIGQTTQADGHGDTIQVCNNKGSLGSTYQIQNNTFPLTLDTTSETWTSTDGVIGNNHKSSLGADIVMPITCFHVYTVSDVATLGISAQIGNDAYYQTRTNKNAPTQIYVGNTPRNGTLDVPHNTWSAHILTHRAAGTVEMWNNVDAASVTASEPASNWPSTQQVIVGANTSGNTNAHVGKIAEWIVYEIDDSGTLVDDLKAYATTKYGITWAT